MFSNLNQFSKELRKFADSEREKVKTIQRWASLEILKRVVMRTPVDTGRARGGWQLTIGEPADGEPERLDKDGGSVLAEEMVNLGGLKDFDVVFIGNNVNYIGYLEDGWSWRQAPRGMLRLTMMEIQRELDDIVL